MAVDHEQMIADATAVAEQSREATPSASTDAEHPAETADRGPDTTATAVPPDPFDSARSALDTLDEDRLRRLAKEHPRLKAVNGEETRALLKQMEGRIEAERRTRAETELDYILADENHPSHYEELEKHGTARKDLATQRVGIRTALERPEVRAAAKVETGQIIVSQLMQHAAFGGISADEWADALNKDDIGAALGDAFTRKLEREKAAWLSEYAPAIEAQAMDKFRAGLPNPDAGRSVTSGRQPGPVTPQSIRDMDARDFIKNADAIWASLPSGRRD